MAPSRRTTLGPVNPNRRTSLGGGAPPANDRKQTKTKSRQSMLPRMAGGQRESLLPPSPAVTSNRRQSGVGTDRRRSGIGGDGRRKSLVPPPPPPAKMDSRPISDKSYQNGCIKRLLQYLLQSGYEYPVTHKSLARPSGKDFQNIVTFLLRRVDPTFHNGNMKFEDEVAMAFKAMGYPFPISKTALVAAGSPHTWPALLAALTWLMELLQCSEAEPPQDERLTLDDGSSSEKAFESLDELEQKTDKAFFKYLSGAYTAFLRGDNAMSGQLEDALVDMFEKDNMIIERELKRVTDLNGSIVEKMDVLGQQSQDLPTLEKKREDYATDLEQFHDLVRQMNEHKEALDKKVKERTAELETTNQELEKVTARVNAIMEQIQTQELSVEDVRKMQSEQTRAEEALERVSTLKQRHQEELWDCDLQFTTLFEELEIAVADYNTKVGAVSTLTGVKCRMDVQKNNAHSKDQSQLLGVDLQSVVVPALNKCKSEYLDRTARAKRENQELLDQLEASEAAVTEALDALKIVEGKKTKCEETLVRKRDEQEGALAVRLREVAAAETKIASLRDPVALEEAILRYQRQCNQLEALQMKHQEENIAKKQAVQDEINAAMRVVADHREHQTKKMAELEQYILAKKASMGKVTVPSKLNLDD